MGIEQQLKNIHIMRKRLESRQRVYDRYLDTFAPQSALSGEPRVQGGVCGVEPRIGQLATLGQDLRELEYVYFSKLQWFWGVLDHMDDPLWEEVLIQHYVHGADVKRISKVIKYSESHIRRCLRCARKEFIHIASNLNVKKDDHK